MSRKIIEKIRNDILVIWSKFSSVICFSLSCVSVDMDLLGRVFVFSYIDLLYHLLLSYELAKGADFVSGMLFEVKLKFSAVPDL